MRHRLSALSLAGLDTMPARRRGLAEVEEAGPPAHTPTPSLLLRLRNFWVFACLMQFIYLFGDVFKIDKDFDIEVRLVASTAPGSGPVQPAARAIGTKQLC